MTRPYTYTAKGRYYRVYCDGIYVSQHTTEREAIESANEVCRDAPDADVLYIHEYEVNVAQTDGGVVEDYADTPADQPPTIISTPAPMFTEGTADTYDMTQHVTDDGLSTVTYSIVTILPNGLSFNTSTGILTYDGVGTPSVSVHQLKATDDAGTATSDNFNIEIHADVTIDNISNITMYVGTPWDMSQYINDTLNRRTATRVTGLPAEITYDNTLFAEKLNASSAKFVTGVQLEVDYP